MIYNDILFIQILIIFILPVFILVYFRDIIFIYRALWWYAETLIFAEVVRAIKSLRTTVL